MRFELPDTRRYFSKRHPRRPKPGILLRSLSLGLVVIIATIFTPSADFEPARAQLPPTPRVSAASTLSVASAGFGPVALNAIIDPGTLERIARQIRDERWKLPDERALWPLEDGKPIVATQQLDELWHTVLPGETLNRLRHMYKHNTSALQRLNPGVNLNELSAGQRIRVWKRSPEHLSKSYGAANHGRLFYGEPLPFSPNYRVLYPHRTFGTYYTISEVTRVLNNFGSAYPDNEPLIVGDISFRNGRKIHPHASHRTGRDIDISYPRKNASETLRRFSHTRRNELDAKKMLVILKDFLDGGYVEYIFMDRHLQKKVRAEALAQGAPQEWIDRVFQYPAYTGGTAIVRHAGGHKNHFHVRFTCQPTDRRCR